jgi:hypothetical protein
MKKLEKKISMRMGFFLWPNGKLTRIMFHYRGTDLVTYRIRLNMIRVKCSGADGNFHFLKTYARKDWEKYFGYKIENNELVVTFKVPIAAVDVELGKKDPDWMVKYDSIDFTGRIGSV